MRAILAATHSWLKLLVKMSAPVSVEAGLSDKFLAYSEACACDFVSNVNSDHSNGQPELKDRSISEIFN